MSQPKRYTTNVGYGHEEHDGEFVLYDDYAALAAENERLRKHRITLIERLDKAIEDINNVAAENERLRKAGDAMKHWIVWKGYDFPGVNDWSAAAKEGGAK